MPSGWEIYSIIFVSSLLALLVPLVLRILSHALSRGQTATNDSNCPENLRLAGKKTQEDSVLGARMNTRFFVGANVAGVLVALALVLIPLASAAEIFAIVSVCTFATLGLLYAARKGDLDWFGMDKRTEADKD